MNSVLWWIGLGCLSPVVYSYLGFPLLLSLWLKLKRSKSVPESNFIKELPDVFIFMAAHNEEKVLQQKLESIFNSDYAPEKLKLWVGSDCSTDATNSILSDWQNRFPNQVYPTFFKSRTGKPGIINELVKKTDQYPGSSGAIFIFTDANVFFQPSAIRELVQSFSDAAVGVVSALIVNREINQPGIGQQEKFYIGWENEIKLRESQLFQAMIGPAGGCFAMRSFLYQPVPAGFLVDDFYLGMKVIEQGYGSVLNPKAICEEDLPGLLSEEYRRKIRIAVGNFQNLKVFRNLLFYPKGVGFCFFSHKVLRWLGPVFMLMALVFFLIASVLCQAWIPLALLLALLPLTLLIEKTSTQLGYHWFVLRAFHYFLSMNLALLHGFTKYLKGTNDSHWEPTRRNT